MGSLLSSHCAQTTHEIQDSPGPDLSIPDQRRQALAYCAANGWDVAIEFVEPGASGTDDRRPELQRLLDMGTAGGAPAKGMDKNDIERFARDHFADAGLAQAAHMHLQRVPPPRVVTGPILLTGIATCAGVRRRYDAAHGKDRPLPLLHPLDVRPAGQERLQRPLYPDGQA
jgi:hypothetical protein